MHAGTLNSAIRNTVKHWSGSIWCTAASIRFLNCFLKVKNKPLASGLPTQRSPVVSNEMIGVIKVFLHVRSIVNNICLVKLEYGLKYGWFQLDGCLAHYGRTTRTRAQQTLSTTMDWTWRNSILVIIGLLCVGSPKAGSLFVANQLKRTIEKTNRCCSASNIARLVFGYNTSCPY